MSETKPPHIFGHDNPVAALEAKIVSTESCVFGGRLTVAVLTLDNGSLVTGECCKDTADGFNAELGLTLALERAFEKAVAMETYARQEIALRDAKKAAAEPPLVLLSH